MAGTKAGGLAAAETNRAKYGGEFYHVIGAKGGKKGHTGGFYAHRELASYYGRIGGTISRRGRTKLTPQEKVKLRRQIEATYKHLLKVNKRAERERSAMLQSA